jgi:hypothetical protein
VGRWRASSQEYILLVHVSCCLQVSHVIFISLYCIGALSYHEARLSYMPTFLGVIAMVAKSDTVDSMILLSVMIQSTSLAPHSN